MTAIEWAQRPGRRRAGACGGGPCGGARGLQAKSRLRYHEPRGSAVGWVERRDGWIPGSRRVHRPRATPHATADGAVRQSGNGGGQMAGGNRARGEFGGPSRVAMCLGRPTWIHPTWIHPTWIHPTWIHPTWIRPNRTPRGEFYTGRRPLSEGLTASASGHHRRGRTRARTPTGSPPAPRWRSSGRWCRTAPRCAPCGPPA